ncbi:MAG: ABC-type transport auxiliary lipoprotein family protein [Wenzhouxiangella sp.]
MQFWPNRVPRTLALLLLPMLLAGCLLGGQGSTISLLAPTLSLNHDLQAESVDWSVQVQRPVADAMRDSDRLLVRRTASRLQVYPTAVWLDSVPDMLQALLVQSLSDSERFDGVARTGGIRTRYSLAIEVRHFEVVDDDGQMAIDIVLGANLVHQRSARSVANRTFRAGGPIPSNNLDDIVRGFEQALEGMVPEMIDWVQASGIEAEARWRERNS